MRVRLHQRIAALLEQGPDVRSEDVFVYRAENDYGDRSAGGGEATLVALLANVED